jgi:diguanylate cyclase (GGDEF)-like protein
MITDDSLRIFFDRLPVGIWEQGPDRKFAWANQAFVRLTGYPLTELRQMETISLIKTSWRGFVLERNKAILRGELAGPYFFPTRTKRREELIVMGTLGVLGERVFGGYIAPVQVDQEREPVSGLLNEIAFYRRVKAAMEACYQQSRPPFTLMFLGVDRFKEHLQALGCTVMDDYIQWVAGKITALLAPDDLAARIGDAQFGLLFPQPLAPRHADVARACVEFAARQSRAQLNTPITLSASVVEYNEDIHATMIMKLISHGHRAMFRVQARGGNDLSVGEAP